jgi:hypothetical protein
MAIWHVRPDASHGGLNSGTSYANAWQGWSSIVFASMAAADTLRIYGRHSYGANILLNKAGVNLSAPTIFEGVDGATIEMTAGFVQLNQSYVLLRDVAIDSTLSDTSSVFMGNRVGITFEDVDIITTVKTSSAAIVVQANAGLVATDHLYRRVRLVGAARTGFQWLCVAGATATVDRMTFDDCDFSNCTQRGIEVRIEPTGAVGSSINNLQVENSRADNCGLIGFDLYQEYTLGAENGVIRGNNLKVRNNRANGCGYGASRLSGFAKSASGWNVIERNEFNYSLGPTGGINLFYSDDMVVRNNSCQHGRATNNAGIGIIDCNGILVDHYNNRTKVYRNNCSDNVGHPNYVNSGCGVMVLESADTEVFSNLADGCSVGLWASTAECTGNNVHNNTFTNCLRFGARIDGLLVGEMNLTNNNITTVGGVDVIHKTSATASIVSSNNNLYGGGHTNFTPSGSDISVDPLLNEFHRPTKSSPLIGAGTHLGYVRDLDGKQRPNPPSIGAYDVANVTTRPRTVG